MSTPLAELTCPHCGSPWMKGTGLFVCGEGTNGNVHGGCREYYTGKLIRSLYERYEESRAATQKWYDEAHEQRIRANRAEAERDQLQARVSLLEEFWVSTDEHDADEVVE